MVTAHSSITNFFSMLGAVVTASPKWEEISTASSSTTPFGSKGFGALVGREMAKGSQLPRGKGALKPPGELPKGSGFGLQGGSGLGMLKRLEDLNTGQMVAVGGELQVLFHTLQAMDNAHAPDGLVKAMTKLLSPQEFEEDTAGFLPGTQGETGKQEEDDLLNALLSMMEAMAPPAKGENAASSSPATQEAGSRASPQSDLADVLAKLLSEAQSTTPPGTGEKPATALNELEQLLSKILDSHAQEQEGGESAAEALSKFVLNGGVAEEQPGHSVFDVQEVKDAKEALFNQRLAVIKRLAQLIGEVLAEQKAEKTGLSKGDWGFQPMKGEGDPQPRIMGLQELISALNAQGESQPPGESGTQDAGGPDLVDIIRELLSNAGSSQSAQETPPDAGEGEAAAAAATPTTSPGEGETLAEILRGLVEQTGSKAKESASNPGTATQKPSEGISRLIQQLLSGGEGQQQPKEEGNQNLLAKEQNQPAFWQRGKDHGGTVTNTSMFAHALHSTIHEGALQGQGVNASPETSHVDKVAETIMNTVRELSVSKTASEHQVNIRMTLDGIHDLDISLSLSGQKEIALSFVADNSQVLHHLSTHAESLKSALQWHDIKVVSLSFNHPETGSHDYQQAQNGFGSSFHSFAQGSNDQAPNGGEFSGFFSHNPGTPGSNTGETAPSSPTWAMDGLNIQA